MPILEAPSNLPSRGTVANLDVRCDAFRGGEKIQCGWLRDKYGVSRQIVPILGELLHDSDPVKSQKVMKAMLGMIKLDIAELKRAFEQG